MLFTEQEYRSRVKKVQQSMAEKGIDLLIASDPANINYLTGHDAWSFYVHQAVVVTLDDDMPYFFGRYMDGITGIAATTYLTQDHVAVYADTYMHNPTCHPMEILVDLIRSLHYDTKRIGVEMDNYWFSAQAYTTLVQGLPDATFVNGNVLVNWVRIIKSDAEIECQKKAGKLVELGMQAAIDTMGPGVKQNEVAAAIYSAQLRGTAEFGGDYAAIAPLIPSGDTAGVPHMTWTDEPYPQEATAFIEIAGSYRKYHAPMSRTVCIGKPDPRVERAAEIAIEGLEAALDAVKPGALLADVESAFAKVLKKYDLEKEARIGYSMGLNYPPDWGEHTASIRKNDMTVLQPNMTFHCIPGLYFPDYGLSISEGFVVTETGCETFANFPRKLFYK